MLAGCGRPPVPQHAIVSPDAEQTCRDQPVLIGPPGDIDGIQFVSATRGWAVGYDILLATTDGGRRWTVQRSGRLNLTSVDFISGTAGWAVGADALLTTSDGGARWTALPEPGPCLPIRSVHFISPQDGFAVAGGSGIADFGPQTPQSGGVVLVTSDGGHSWRVRSAPADAQTVCFSDPRDGWLGAGGRLYRTTDGGRSWAQVTAGMQPASDGGFPTVMIVQCAGADSAWALDVGMGANMSKQPNVGYRVGPAGAVPIFAGQYLLHPGIRVTAASPGAYAGPFSAISPSAAAFVGWCPACAEATAAVPWDLATGSRLVSEGDIDGLISPGAASFLSPRLGWVAGAISSTRTGIAFTDNGGRTWHVQYVTKS